VDLLFADWVFGYGSLIWNPEVDFNRSELGRVHGYHRAFCIRSTRYRGTPEQPGVVLGLERGGSCVGVAYRLRHDTRRHSIERLYEREMLNRVYVRPWRRSPWPMADRCAPSPSWPIGTAMPTSGFPSTKS
jgi:cation transport regulator ChaC